MTTVSEIYPSKWVTAQDLKEHPTTVTIVKATVESIRQRSGHEEPRAVLEFKGARKRLILNKTNAQTLAKIAKSEKIADWAGLTIQLVPATASNGRPTIAILAATQTQDEQP
jgi:hypothetical protein